MELLGNTMIIVGIVGVCAYPLARSISMAYFQSKLEYQNKFFRKFDRDTGAK